LATINWEKQQLMSLTCQECAFFEKQACLEKVAFCAKLHGPSIEGCGEFEPINKAARKESSIVFCADCLHFENMLGLSVCSRAHKHGIACPAFKRKVKEQKVEPMQTH
jgi:hypothetical protein